MIFPWKWPSLTLMVCGLAASLTLLIAFALQFLGGYEPCPICIWQRWPYLFGGLALCFALSSTRKRCAFYGAVAGLIFLAGSGLSFWHAGIEQGFWSGPAVCQNPLDVGGQSASELLARLEATPLVRCDVPALRVFSLSLATWSGLILLWLAWMTLIASAARLLKDAGPHPSKGNPPSSRGDS